MLAATCTFCLILWREEDTHSVVPVMRISSPLEEIVPGAMCRVKGCEKFISEVVAMGTEEINQQLDLLDEDPPADDVEPPQRDGKENNEPRRKRKGGRPPRDKDAPPPRKPN